MIMPVFEYSLAPTCIMSETNKNKLQQFQNKNIRQLHFKGRNNEDEVRLTLKEMHKLYKLDPINIRIYKRAQATWERFRNLNPELAEISQQIDEEIGQINRDHYWWPRVGAYINKVELEPKCEI